jgi:hypothetical protein
MYFSRLLSLYLIDFLVFYVLFSRFGFCYFLGIFFRLCLGGHFGPDDVAARAADDVAESPRDMTRHR